MCEQHLAEALKQLFVVLKYRQRDILERQSLHARAVGSAAHERNERRAQRRDRVSGLLRKAVAVAGRAGQRIGFSSRRNDHAVGTVSPSARRHAADRAGLLVPHNTGHRCVLDDHARLMHRMIQRIHDVDRAVGLREHAVSALGLERNALRLKEIHRVLHAERIQRAVQKPRILRHIC